jgi:hypothetical protein
LNRKEYLKNYQKNWVKQRRLNFFNNKSCVQCGSAEKLELDHIDPSKKITHRIWSRNEKFRNEELSKCQVLCEKCHKQKTAQYCKDLFTNKEIKSSQTISDDIFYRVIELNNNGFTLREACEKVGILYSTFSSTKSRKKRIFK